TADAASSLAKEDLVKAYDDAASRVTTQAVTADLGGQTLVPGVYRSASGLGLTGTVTLNGQGDPSAVFIFQAASTLITASSSAVSLINGAQACNVFWQVSSSGTLGTDTAFVGTILAQASITLNTGAAVDGRALARTGSVTLDSNVFTNSACVSVPPTTTTLPGSTTTVAGSTTTTVPASTTTIPGSTTTVPRTTTTSVPASTTTVPGSTTTVPQTTTTVPASTTTVPRTTTTVPQTTTTVPRTTTTTIAATTTTAAATTTAASGGGGGGSSNTFGGGGGATLGSGTLAFTGLAIRPFLELAVICLLVGTSLLVLVHRRRRLPKG
nr:ice-binding family protein [Actinomycetota bacterium]